MVTAFIMTSHTTVNPEVQSFFDCVSHSLSVLLCVCVCERKLARDKGDKVRVYTTSVICTFGVVFTVINLILDLYSSSGRQHQGVSSCEGKKREMWPYV